MNWKISARWLPVGGLFVGLLVGAAGASVAQAQDRMALRNSQSVPAHIEALKLDAPAQVQVAQGAPAVLSPSLAGASGNTRVIIRLTLPAAGEMADKSAAARLSRKVDIDVQQAGFIQRCSTMAPDMKVIARTQLVLNAVFVEVDAAYLSELGKDPAVARITRVRDYEMDLSETVPYIGASAVQAAGYDGSGVRVAVLDSGIDYNHGDLGGSGDPADYTANDPNIIEPGSFPTAKVVGGYDFVGSNWPGTAEEPDADPLDDGVASGHGTHVADIIGGANGVAPGADLYAVKVCSSVSTSCSGIALIQGMEFAVDPNGDFDTRDHVDIVNMSLGSNYGQPFDDDLSLAVDNASAYGVLTVASAGNSADKPYITGSPAAAPTALSVAQTQVPSASLQLIETNGLSVAAVFQPWSTPLAGALSGVLQYGDGAGGNLDGCAAFAADSLTGLVVLVDRGACNFTLKIKNIGDAGGIVGIIGLIAPGAPFSGGDGGDAPITIPGYMISQADSIAMMADVGATTNVDSANQLPLVMQMVGSSSRGPSGYYNAIKPEIGAPGASVSAIAGSGTGTGPFGGTSGAAPMVAGSAALLMDAHPRLRPAEVKARLMNTGETEIYTDPFTGLAPITRIGGGEVRVDRAVDAPVSAWDVNTGAGALSFGFLDAWKETTRLVKTVRVRNYSGNRVTYNVEPSFRYMDDADNGAVSVTVHPSTITLGRYQSKTIRVKVTIDGAALRGNFMNSGSMGADPSALTTNEYDGYLNFTSTSDADFHMAWQVLPRQAARLVGDKNFNVGGDTVQLTNTGAGTAQMDGYSWIGRSGNQPEGVRGGQSPMPDLKAVGVQTFPVDAGFCSAEASFLWAFAVNTWERQESLVPVVHNVYLDTNQDGIFDYVVFNFDLSFSGAVSDGRQVTWAFDLATGAASAFFFTEHAMNTANTGMLICGEQIGLTGTDMLATNVDAYVVTEDFYFGGPGDQIGSETNPLTITPLGERFLALPSDIPGQSSGAFDILDFGDFPGNSTEFGVLMITNGDRGAGARGGATKGTEALRMRAQ